MMLMKRVLRTPLPLASGFTLVEVLVALVVTAVGLLGLAKMQALAVSGAKNSGSRSLMALQVGSLVSSMHANGAYWNTAPSTAFTVTGTTVTDSTGVLSATVSSQCTTKCSPANMAASDVQNWAAGMLQQFPTYNAKVNCTNSTGQPVSCQIYITWSENKIAVNTATTGGSNALTQSFSVFIEP
ncbi:type IV pilus modification protein PilV [Glaciimonas sp. PCH181]|nr:type IV pilus modification protein PilV [Glaciimonas sp. PCH181]PUA18363.1 type IV pilus modification protein PilV [Glaciimonas sp. PCH181]